MNNLCTFGGSALCSWLGWYLAAPLGLGWAFALSAVGGIIGVWLGWKLARRFI